MASVAVEEFCKLYRSLNKRNLAQLREVYSDDIVFIDPIHHIQGIDALCTYFAHLYENMQECHFHIKSIIEQPGEASIIWQMIYSHDKINRGKPVLVNGCSHLCFSEKIEQHRDYLDLGEMLYEQLPLIGAVVKRIKKRASQ